MPTDTEQTIDQVIEVAPVEVAPEPQEELPRTGLSRAVDGAVRWPANRTRPVDPACPECIWAFQATYAPRQEILHDNGGACRQIGYDQPLDLPEYGWSADPTSHDEPVMWLGYFDVGTWDPLVDADGLDTTLILTDFDIGQRVEWSYTQTL